MILRSRENQKMLQKKQLLFVKKKNNQSDVKREEV